MKQVSSQIQEEVGTVQNSAMGIIVARSEFSQFGSIVNHHVPASYLEDITPVSIFILEIVK
jgi:hypothetical protein